MVILVVVLKRDLNVERCVVARVLLGHFHGVLVVSRTILSSLREILMLSVDS